MEDSSKSDVTPSLSAIDAAAVWYIEALEAGKPPTEQDMKARFPEIYDELRLFARNYHHVANAAEDYLSDDSAPAPEIVQELGDYELLHQIGKGGMGVVYRARQKSLNRVVALKLILAGKFASDDDLKRFEREAKATAQLRHPNIISVFDYNEHEGQAYIVMDYVQGPTLSDRVRAAPLDANQAARMIQSVAEAVSYAHQQSIIHRDIKPSNIILERETNEPKLTDFGLAKHLTVDAAGSATVDFGVLRAEPEDLTGSGSVVGTLQYMAPEQMRADCEIGPTADIYGLGATLYQLITGLAPFWEEDRVELLVRIRNAEPTAPRRLNARVPVDLQRICLKCLEKDSKHRYLTAQELADDLGRYLRGEAIHARSIGPIRRVGKWIKRKPQTAAMVLLAAIALFILTFGGYAFALREAVYRREATRFAEEQAAARVNAESLLAQSYTDKGISPLDAGDVFRAFPWFVRSSQVIQHDSDAYAIQRRRCHTLLLHAPQLMQVWFHGGAISNLEMATSGDLLAVSSHDRTTTLWNIETGDAAAELVHDGVVFHASIDARAQHIVTAAGDAGAYLWDLTDPSNPQALQAKHRGPVSMVAFDPRGESFATASGQKNLVLSTTKIPIVAPMRKVNGVWIRQGRTRSFQPPARGSYKLFSISNLKDPSSAGSLPGWGNHVSFSHDGRWLFAGGGSVNGKPRAVLVDTNINKPKKIEWQFSGDINHACFSRDNSQLLLSIGSFRRKGYAEVWDIESGTVRGPKLEHPDQVVRAFFLPGDNTVITASSDGSARAWEISSGIPLGLPMLHDDRISDAAVDESHRLFATASHDGTARIWQPATGQPLTPPLRHGCPVTAVRFTPDSRFLATGDTNGVVRLWRIFQPEELHSADEKRDPITGIIDGNQDGQLGAVIGSRQQLRYSSTEGLSREIERIQDSRVVTWNLNSDRAIEAHSSRPKSLNVSGRFAAIVSQNEEDKTLSASVLHLPTGEQLMPAIPCPSTASHAVCDHDGTLLVVAFGAEEVVWTYDSGWSETGRISHSGQTNRTIVSPDGLLAASVIADKSITLWSTRRCEGTELVELEKTRVGAMAFSPDGEWFAAATGGDPFTNNVISEVHVWKTDGRHEAGPLTHREFVTDIQFDLRRSRILTACEDGFAYLWDMTSGKPAAAGPLYHEGGIEAARFSPDGHYAATASADGSARLWDAESGDAISPPLLHPSVVRTVSFISGGQQLATGCDDGVVRLWPLPTTILAPEELRLLSELLSVSRLATSSSHPRDSSFVLPTIEIEQKWKRLQHLSKK